MDQKQVRKRVYIVILFFVIFSLQGKSAWANLVYRYMDMPSDSVILFPDFPNTFQGSLTSYGISTLRPAGLVGFRIFILEVQ